MCLTVCEESTAKFFEQYKDRKFVKLLKYIEFCADIEYATECGNPKTVSVVVGIKTCTPYQSKEVIAGWLTPTRKYEFVEPIKTINGGAIHAYLTNRLVTADLEDSILSDGHYYRYKVYKLNCWAKISDVIKVGNREDVAVKRLYIPQKELDRCSKDLCEIITKQCSSSKDSASEGTL